jgi:hypothetical protein
MVDGSPDLPHHWHNQGEESSLSITKVWRAS